MNDIKTRQFNKDVYEFNELYLNTNGGELFEDISNRIKETKFSDEHINIFCYS